jgi:hypothetical protein
MAMKQNLADVEKAVGDDLESKLIEPAEVSQTAFNLISDALASALDIPVAEVRPSLRVTTALLVRLGNEVRCIALLALRGYAVQAVSLLATVYEVAYAIARIGCDDDVARTWIEHEGPLRPPPPFASVMELTLWVLERLGIPNAKEQASSQYRVYTQACMAKHANPLLQTQFGLQREGSSVVAAVGPESTPAAVRAAWWALGHAAGLSALAVMRYARCHVRADRHATIERAAESIFATAGELAVKGMRTYGTEDPFPGKWR